jgi:single-stranded-DNA-specific exonuclease
MTKRWIFKPQPEAAAVEALSNSLNINPVLASILCQRQISDFETARDFFRPSLEHLHDPFLMADMEQAVQRLQKAIIQNERILVYGDYDVDGTCSVAMFYSFLKSFYPHTEYYIPDRYAEGYGISRKGIEWAHENNFALIVSLDCGIKAEALIADAKAMGIDFIICDHHQPGETLPPAVAVLDPKRSDCLYPFKELSGCGVGFKLIQAFTQFHGEDQSRLWPLLDLVVVSIASDIVPIVGENRTMAYYGLEQLNTQPRAGLKALMEFSGVKPGKATISSIVFGIGPRINAAGRVAHAKASVEVLLADNEKDAMDFGEILNDRNSERRNFDMNITEEAIGMIDGDVTLRQAKTTVLYSENWHKGVIGIVASRCIEKYYRPTIILTESNNKATGSARSVKGFDIYEAISDCSEFLEQFGGHKYAAGLTMSIDKVEAFRQRFEQIVAERITDDQLEPQLEIDMPLDLDRINDKFYRIICQMAPFGPENMQPVFAADHLYVWGGLKLLKEKHLKFTVGQEGSQRKIDVVGFGMSDLYEPLLEGKSFSMAFTMEENNFKDMRTLQLFAKDIQLHTI